MTLSKRKAELFTDLWLSLLYYATEKHQKGRSGKAKPVDPKTLVDRVWDNPTLIDEYLEEHPELPVKHRDIVQGWKRRVRGDFILERLVRNGAIFMSPNTGKVYQVSGIVSSFEEMFEGERLPVVVNTTLLPFCDVIITDGVLLRTPLEFGSDAIKMFSEAYREAKVKKENAENEKA